MLIWQAAENNAGVIRNAVTSDGQNLSLEAVCDLLDITVKYSYDLPDDVSGLIVKRENDPSATIEINAFDSERRQRFTLAHELGHYIERRVEAKDNEYAFVERRSDKYDLHEFYADQFAGALLMPEAEVLKIAPDLDDRHAVNIAARFEVSVPAAEKRLERLRKQLGEAA